MSLEEETSQDSSSVHLKVKAAVQEALREELGGASFGEILLRSLRQALQGLAAHGGDDEHSHSPFHSNCLRGQSISNERIAVPSKPPVIAKTAVDATSKADDLVVEEVELARGPSLGVPAVSGMPAELHLMPIVPDISSQILLPAEEPQMDEMHSESLADSDSQGTWATPAKEIPAKTSVEQEPARTSMRRSVGDKEASTRTSCRVSRTTGRRRSNTRTTMMDVFESPADRNPKRPSEHATASSDVKPTRASVRKSLGPRKSFGPAPKTSLLQHQLHPDLLKEIAGKKASQATATARMSMLHEGDGDEGDDDDEDEEELVSGSDDDTSSSDSETELEEIQKPPPQKSNRCERLLESGSFEFFITACIFANSVLLGFQTDFAVQHLEDDDPAAYQVIDRLLSAIFFAELLLKLFAYKFTFFTRPGKFWNALDLLLVLQQIVEDAALAANTDGSVAGGGDLGFLRILRMLRLLRVMRILRLVRSFQELRNMVFSIKSSINSLAGTTVLIIMLIYIVGVCFGQVLSFSGQQRPDLLHSNEGLDEFWGSLPRSTLTLFMAITGGVNWYLVLDPLSDHVSPWLVLPFVMYITFALLAMMNVITGVFVESALGRAKEERERELQEQLRNLFTYADSDGSGQITWDEFENCLSQPKMAKVFGALGVNTQEARALFVLLDAEEEGSVAFEDFLSGCMKLKGTARAIDLETLMYFNKRTQSWLDDELHTLKKCLNELHPKGQSPTLQKQGALTRRQSVSMHNWTAYMAASTQLHEQTQQSQQQSEPTSPARRPSLANFASWGASTSQQPSSQQTSSEGAPSMHSAKSTPF